MARKPRPDPLTQGSLMDIYKYFFAPLIYYKPLDMSVRDWLEYLFDYKARDVFRYRAKRSFKMPGTLYMAGSVKVQGLGYRAVRADDILYVRTDQRTEFVDIEFVAANNVGGEQVFNLTQSEWNQVRPHLEFAERKRQENE